MMAGGRFLVAITEGIARGPSSRSVALKDGRRVESIRLIAEELPERWVVAIGVLSDEVDDLAVPTHSGPQGGCGELRPRCQ